MSDPDYDWVEDGAAGEARDLDSVYDERPTRDEIERDDAAPGPVLPRCETTPEHAAELTRTGGNHCRRCGHVYERAAS